MGQDTQNNSYFLSILHFSKNPHVRLFDGWSVCHNFLNGREVTLRRSYQSTCFFSFNPMLFPGPP